MLKAENIETYGWEAAIRGMRNPMNSWDKSDSYHYWGKAADDLHESSGYEIGDNDLQLMKSLAKGGPVHAKFRRMLTITMDITAPLYWWKEFDTYKVGTVANSCSTMHKIHAKEFTLDDFSHEHLLSYPDYEEIPDFENDEDIIKYKKDIKTAFSLMREGKEYVWPAPVESAAEREAKWHYDHGAYYAGVDCDINGDMSECADAEYALNILEDLIYVLNIYRSKFLETKDKRYWWQMIQLLPSSYNQRRTVQLNYEVAHNIYISRKDHKLDEWHTLCDALKSLPMSELITGELIDD